MTVKNHSELKFVVFTKDVPFLDDNLRDFEKGQKKILRIIKSVQHLADYNPALLTQIDPEKYEIQLKKRDAMVIDTAETIKILALGLRLCADYAINSAYAVQYIQGRFTYLEKSVDKIAKETDVDLSSIKKKIKEVETTLQSPVFTDVVQMFKEGKANVEKARKRGEETFDNFTRSH